MKPAKPDSFAGKTFLGASAAALVGSLAKFTGKAPQRPADPPVKADEPAKADTRHLEADTSPEDVAPDADKDFDDLPAQLSTASSRPWNPVCKMHRKTKLFPRKATFRRLPKTSPSPAAMKPFLKTAQALRTPELQPTKRTMRRIQSSMTPMQ